MGHWALASFNFHTSFPEFLSSHNADNLDGTFWGMNGGKFRALPHAPLTGFMVAWVIGWVYNGKAQNEER